MMSSKELSIGNDTGWLASLCRQLVVKRLQGLCDGQLSIREADYSYEAGQAGPLDCQIDILDASAWVDIALGGSIGAGESYMAGMWQANDLTTLTRLFARNRDRLDALESGANMLLQPLGRLLHWSHRNSRRGSKANIAAHYDLGNDMFAQFLDPRMMYSSAIYPDANADLDTAATYKLQRIGEKLRLNQHDHLLEIGTGWGGLAIYMAQQYGCRVTTATISQQQYALACARVKAAGLQDRISILLCDYRDLEGQYDKLVSIEMIEAVGLDFLPEYFAKCSHLLKPDGAFLLQSITIADQRYAYAAKHVDFIQKHIFPGGALPSTTRISECMRDFTDMQLRHIEDIGLHYAKTLGDWRHRFNERLHIIEQQGYDERFIRMWNFYLHYCAGGFLERTISCGQYLFHKPRCELAWT